MQEEMKRKALPTVMALSYLGDARHSLYVRRMLVGRGIAKSKELNALALEYVTAEAQSRGIRRFSFKRGACARRKTGRYDGFGYADSIGLIYI